MAGVYGPERKPLGHIATTRLLDELWPETEDDRIARETREQNDAVFTEAVQRWFRDSDPGMRERFDRRARTT